MTLWLHKHIHNTLEIVVFFLIQGHEKEALQLMATYLPKDTSPGSAYQEGGGLYALGLIHANHGGDIIDYLLSQLKNASNDVRTSYAERSACLCGLWKETNKLLLAFFSFQLITVFIFPLSFGLQIVRHGGALGLGLAALGTARQDVYDLLKSNLYQDDAVTGV